MPRIEKIREGEYAVIQTGEGEHALIVRRNSGFHRLYVEKGILRESDPVVGLADEMIVCIGLQLRSLNPAYRISA